MKAATAFNVQNGVERPLRQVRVVVSARWLVVLTVLVRAEVAAARLQPSAAMVYSVHIHFGHSLGMDSG
jgi:hypothetical protein